MDLIEKPHRQREPVPEDAEDAMRTSGNQFVIITHRWMVAIMAEHGLWLSLDAMGQLTTRAAQVRNKRTSDNRLMNQLSLNGLPVNSLQIKLR